MKFKKNWKRFWTLYRRHDGFTLVELIVVIAILAILAGVAVPAYSGYVEKARYAADEQLLAAVNTAFAAACVEKGINPYTDLDSSTAKMPVVDGAINVAGVLPAAVQPAFEVYFAGNESAKFEVITSLMFDVDKCTFVDVNSADGVTLSYRGTVVHVPAGLVATLGSSSFVQSENGVSDLLDQVDWVTGIAAGLANQGKFGEYLYDCLYATFGVTDPTNEQQMAAFATEYSALADQKAALLKQNTDMQSAFAAAQAAGGDDFDAEEWWLTQARTQIAANNAVLHAAQNVGSINSDTFLTNLSTNGMTASDFKSFLSNGENSSAALSEAAATYAMYTAYVNTLEGQAKTDASANLGNLTGMMNSTNGINSTAFKDWLKTEQAETDLEAYKSSMELINNSVAGGATNDLLVNGFADEALKQLLTDALG